MWTPTVEGEGVSQMITLPHKPYLVKVSAKVEDSQKCPIICPRGL